jgi:energy-coupling factor transporter ATP-binding protein EcfA2
VAPVLIAKNISFEGLFQDLTLELEVGQCLALVGANGSGKSTLLRVLAGLLTPTQGQVLLDNQPLNEPGHPSLGLVFQNPESQLVANTVEDEVAFGPGQRGCPPTEIEQRVVRCLSQVGLLERRLWQSHALSAGQKQRLAIAAVLASQPRFLLLDEPTSMLDARARREWLEILQQLRPNLGILWVTHRSEELAHCDQVLHLHQSRLSAARPCQGLVSFDYQQLGLSVPHDVRSRELLREGDPLRDLPPSDVLREGDLTPLVVARELGHRYARKTPLEHAALRQFSAQLRGPCCALVGATGSGKSTFLQHLNLLLRHQEGELEVLGMAINSQTVARHLRRQVGLLFQQPELQFFEETAWAEVAYAARNFGLEVESQVRSALAAVSLDEELMKQRSPFQLSGGEQRRLALASVLSGNPKLLLLDEPSAGLDGVQRLRLWQLLHERMQEGLHLVLVSHDLEEVAELASWVCWLEQGQLHLQGPTREILLALAAQGWEIPAWISSTGLLRWQDVEAAHYQGSQVDEGSSPT